MTTAAAAVQTMTSLSVEEWEAIERDEHDQEYAGNAPFLMSPAQMIAHEDYCYKLGCRRDRGHRTRRAFELIDLETLPGKNVLDIGCGSGKYSVLFALLGANVWGYDISPVGVHQGQALAAMNGVDRQCHFSVQNAAKTNYESEQFDVVVMHEVFHHAIKYPGVKDEVRRVLKPGGKLVMTETLYGNALVALGRSYTMRGKEAKGDVILTLDDIRHFCRGFSEVRIEMMSLLFMGKRVFEKMPQTLPLRAFLFLLKKADDVLLTFFPFLRKYCGECVVTLIK